MLLPIIFDGRQNIPPSVICCIGYDLNKWRFKRLSKYVLDAIPEFVLTGEEIAQLEALTPYSTLEKAIPHFTDPQNPSSGGEVGELLAHSILQRDFGTFQLVKRLHYKMRSRDAVTGFDVVHASVDANDQISVWLGESKFIANHNSAIAKAIKSLDDHIAEGVLTQRKSLIGPKLDRAHPHYQKFQWLFHPDTALDEIVSRLIVPVFIGCDTISASAGDQPPSYLAQVTNELGNIRDKISSKHGTSLELVFIYVPLNNKSSFDSDFHARLAAFA